MADGWLFRLRSTLGSQHAVPAWPVSNDPAAEPWPALRTPAPAPDCGDVAELADDA